MEHLTRRVYSPLAICDPSLIASMQMWEFDIKLSVLLSCIQFGYITATVWCIQMTFCQATICTYTCRQILLRGLCALFLVRWVKSVVKTGLRGRYFLPDWIYRLWVQAVQPCLRIYFLFVHPHALNYEWLCVTFFCQKNCKTKFESTRFNM